VNLATIVSLIGSTHSRQACASGPEIDRGATLARDGHARAKWRRSCSAASFPWRLNYTIRPTIREPK